MWQRSGWLAAWLLTLWVAGSARGQVVTFQTATSSVNENATTLSVVVTRTPAAGLASVSYATVDGSATAPLDYTATAGNLAFGIGEVVKVITIPITDDALPELRKTFSLRLYNVTGATLGISTNVVTIVDDDAFYAFSAQTYGVTEGATNVLVTVNRNGSTENPGTVQLLTQNGSALAGLDYTATNLSLNFAIGQTSAVVNVGIIDNFVVNPNAFFQVVLSNAVGGLLAAPSTATVFIFDNDSTNGTVQISSPMQVVSEAGGGGIITIRVDRLGGTNGAITVDWFPLNNPSLTNICVLGTNATPNVDYTNASGTLSWADGDRTSQFITLGVIDDNLVENDEVIVIGLRNPTGGAIINNNRMAVVVILSDDQPPGAADLLFNSVSVSVPGPGANNSVYATAVHPTNGTITIGGDFTAVNAVVRNRIARVFSTGLVDDTFNPGTGADGPVNAVVLQPDGRVLIGGGFTSINNVGRRGVARLNVDGTLDTTFNPGAGVNGAVNALLLQLDGKLVIAGDFTSVNNTPQNRIARLNANGTLDATFDSGTGADGPIYALNGNFVPALLATGTAGTGFGNGPFPATNTLVGYSNFNPAGVATVDVGSGVTNEELRGVVKFVLPARPAAPQATLAFNFVNSGGSFGQTGGVFNIQLEAYITNGLITLADYDQPPAVAVLTNFSSTNFTPGRRLSFDVTAFVNNALANNMNIGFRLRPASDPGTNAAVRFGSFALTLASSGSILVGGNFNSFNGVPRPNLIRLGGNGSVDFSFNPVSGPDGAVFALQLQPDNRILVGGAFQHYDALRRRGIVRLATNGLPDLTFDPITGVNGLVRSIGVQTNGLIIAGGSFSSFAGVGRTNLARLYADGSVDTSFLDPFYNSIQPGPNGPVYTLTVQPNNEVVIGGSFTQVGAGVPPVQVTPRLNFARLLGGDVQPVGNMPGNAELSASDFRFSVDENVLGGVVNIGVRRINGFQGPLEVTYGTRDGSAVAGRDYVPTSGVLRFDECVPVGTNQFFRVSIINNDILDGNRSFQVFLSSPTAPGVLSLPALAFTNTATVTIVDNEFTGGTVGFAAAVYTVSENAGVASILVERTNGAVGIATVQYAVTAGSAVAGQDFTAVSGILTFNSAQTNATFTVPILDDTGVEFEETVNLTLSNPTGGVVLGRTTATLLIQDNDNGPGTLGFAAGVLPVSESAGALTVVVLRNSGGAGTLTVQATTVELAPGTPGAARAAIDYMSVTTNLTFGPGVFSRSFQVPILTDRLVEGDEVFLLRLSNLTGGATLGFLANATVVIQDDDFYGRLGFAAASFFINERQTNAVITIDRVGGDSDVVAVDFYTSSGTAAAGVDFTTVSNRLVFADGERSKTVLVPLVNDTLLEGAETVFLTLTNFSKSLPGTHSNAVLTIFDDEAVSIPAGARDTSFFSGLGGFVNALALQPDGRLVAAGDFTNYSGLVVGRILRLGVAGLVDPTFQPGRGPNGPIHALALQSDGHLLVGGSFTAFSGTNHSGVTRLNDDGAIDTTFNPGAGADAEVFALAVQPDGKILVGGAFITFNGISRPYLVRLLANGTLDATFNPGLGPDNRVHAIALLPDGKIMIGGEFGLVNGATLGRVARLNADGSVDGTFAPGTGADATVRAVLALADGSVLVGGSFTTFNGVNRGGLAHLAANGSLDAAFPAGGAGADGAVLAIVRQPDGRVVLGGDFTHYNGVNRGRLARIQPDGSVDPSINFGSGADAYVAALAVQPDEKIVLSGGFTTFDGVRATYLTRLVGGENPGAGRFEFAAPVLTATEGGSAVEITVKRQGGLAGAVSVGFNTVDGTALAGTHYTGVTGTLAFPEGEVFQTFLVPLLNNAVLDPDRTVSLQLNTPTGGAALGGVTNAQLVIRDDDCTVGFATATFSVNENVVGGQATLSVVRAGATNTAVTVSFTTTTNGTATAGADFTAASTLLTFAPGELTKTITVQILNDLLPEAAETVGLALTNLQFASLTTATMVPGIMTAGLTIVDDELAPGLLNFAAPTFTVSEAAGTVDATITVTRTNGTTGVITVGFATSDGSARAGADYLATSGTLSFADGEATKSFTVSILADLVSESSETVDLTLANPTGGAGLGLQSSATLLIQNNDVLIFGNLVFSSPTYTVSESDGAAVLTVNRVGGTQANVSVAYATTTAGTATAGFHYTPASGVLNWAAVDNSARFVVIPIFNNSLVDGSRTVVVALSNPTGGAGLDIATTATLTITDDDSGPGVIGFASGLFDVLEHTTNALVTVTRTNGFTGTVTAQFATFTNTSDRAVAYPGSGPLLPEHDYSNTVVTVTFADGVTSQTVRVPVLDNVQQDGDRTLSVRLSGVTGGATLGAATAVVRIRDNEPSAGAVDNGLFSGSGANGTVYSIGQTTNGLVVLGGDFTTFAGVARGGVARLNLDGTLDSAFDARAIVEGAGNPGRVRAVGVYGSGAGAGRVVIGGLFSSINGIARTNLARLNPDGSVDFSFNPGAGVNSLVNAVALQNDGRVVIGGAFTTVNRTNRNFVARLNFDGSLDASFGAGEGPNGLVRAVAVQTDGKVIIAGDFETVDGVTNRRLARLDLNGALDPTFAPGTTITNGTIFSLAVQVNGQILAGGAFTATNGVVRTNLVRFNANGSVDSGFNPGAGPDDFVAAVTVQPDGRILVGGAFVNFSGYSRSRLVRLEGNGAVDPTMNLGTGADSLVTALAVQGNGRVLVGGAFTSFNGVPQNRFTRLHGGRNFGEGAFKFAVPVFTVSEATTNAVLTVLRTGGTSNGVAVDYAVVAGGTALAGVDYLPVGGTLFFGEGETLRTFVVPVVDDTAVRPDRTVQLALTNPTGRASLDLPATALLRITENDSQIAFAAATFSVNEAAGNAVVTVVRSAGTNEPVSVEYFTTALTATAGVDYTDVVGVLQFAAGVTNQTFSLPLVDDAFVEGGESVALFLTNAGPVGIASLGTLSNATLIIVDNDFGVGVLGFSATNYSAFENGGSATITVVRTNGSSGAVTVSFATVDGGGTATAGVDYLSTNGLLTLADGETSKTFIVGLLNDTVVETNETVALVLFNPTGGVGLGLTNTLLTIVDDDAFGTFQFSTNSYSVVESEGTVAVTVTRTGGIIGAVTVDFVMTDGSAVGVLDYIPASQVLSFAPGQATTNINVVIVNDAVVEPVETISLALTNPTGGALLGLFTNATITITDDDMQFSYAATNFSVQENGTNVFINVVRFGVTNLTGRVDYATADGTALTGTDYVGVTNTLVFLPGVISTNFAVAIVDNQIIQLNRLLNLSLTNATATDTNGITATNNASVATNAIATITIVDDDSVFNFSAVDYNVNEAAGFANVTVLRSGQNPGPVSVSAATEGRAVPNPATAGIDYVAASQTLVFNPGQSNAIFSIQIVADTLPEGNEAFGVFLTNPLPAGGAQLGATNRATVSILDDDIGIGFSAATYTVSETAGVATISVLRAGVTNLPVSVTFFTTNGTAIAGLDYVATNGVFTFAAGVISRSFTVSIINDSVSESPETVSLVLTNPTGGAFLTISNAVLTIVDNVGTIGFTTANFVVGESIPSGVATVARTGGSSGAVTVQYLTVAGTATAGLDYAEVGGTLVWTDGESGTKSFLVPIFDDSLIEATEAVGLRLLNATGGATFGRSNATLSIVDNDGAGGVDFAFDSGVGFDNSVYAAAQQANGQLLAAGRFLSFNGTNRSRVARLNLDGSLDTTYNAGLGPDNAVNAVALQSDGRLIIVGDFTSVGGTLRSRVARLQADGSLDTTFSVGSGANNSVNATALQADGKVIIGGSFTSYGGTARTRLARLNSSGSLDTSFDPGAGANGFVNTIALYPASSTNSGKLLVGGSFTTFRGTPANRIVRLNADGTVDSTFNPGTGANSTVASIAIQSDGPIVIAGLFSAVNGTTRSRMARLNHDGTLDAVFAPVMNDTVLSVAVQPDGRVVAGGAFTVVGGDTGVPPSPGIFVSSRARTANVVTLTTSAGHNLAIGSQVRISNVSTVGAPGFDGTFTVTAVPSATSFSYGSVGADQSAAAVTGSFVAVGVPLGRVARFLADGRLDDTFNAGTGADNLIYTVLLQADRKIVLTGDFTSVNSAVRGRIARLNGGITTPPADTAGFSAGQFYSYLTVAPNRTYRIDYTTDFRTWTELGTVTSGQGLIAFIDPASVNSPGRYYRVVQLP
ncbi:MAG: hypothetical protein RL514_1098 [Verrucomicrobiota bacterium]|jgi:uncharacterized delta-60 repeat protein